MYYHMGSGSEVVLFSEATNVLSLWEVGVLCSEVVLFSEATKFNVLSLWEVGVLCCPLLRGNKCIITMGSGSPCSEVVLFSEDPGSTVQYLQ